MNRWVAVLFALVLLMPAASAMSLKELVAKYMFSYSSNEISSVNYTDYMADKDGNGLNETLIIELAANANGNFIFVVNVLDRNGILSNETNATFSGAKKINATFGSYLLSQDRFNYSVKVYNSTSGLKYRKDNIPASTYANYGGGFSLLEISDSKMGSRLSINLTINSSFSGAFQSILFLKYNSSAFYSKQNFQFIQGENHLVFEFDNETIKKTHYAGKYYIPSLKIGGKAVKADYTTSAYDFRDFAATSYIYGFTDGKSDSDAGNNLGYLQINATIQALSPNIYNLKIYLHDLFGSIVEIKNISASLGSGSQTISANISGAKIYNKKLNGPFTIKRIELYENYALADQINDAYTTSNYNFNDFSASLPDITASISVSDGYHYGINNITVNVTLKNSGSKPAFNVFFDIFGNNTLFKTNKSDMLFKNSEFFYQLNFTNASDFEISAIADAHGIIDESNESNNAERASIKINNKPVLFPISSLIVNETDSIIVNLSASDPDGDPLLYSVNLTKLSSQSGVFRWQTTTMDSGNYTIIAFASDGYLNDSKVFNIAVADAPDKDSDNDGINDALDKVIGNENSVNTSTTNLRLFINSSSNLSRLFDGQATVAFMDGNLTIAELEFDFLNYRLNLTNLTIEKQASNSTGSLIFRGLGMPAGMTKKLYVDKLNTSINGVCIKDDEISSIGEISNNCDSINEFKIECDGTAQNSYSCTYNSSLGKYEVEGLKHSGIIQFSYSKPGEEFGSSGSSGSSGSRSGGGLGVSCVPDWKCGEWNSCSNGIQARICHDKNQCAFHSKKPEESRKCLPNGNKIGMSQSKNRETVPADFSNDSKSGFNQQFSGITGKAVDTVSNNKFSPLAFVMLGMLILLAGYFVIKKHSMKNF